MHRTIEQIFEEYQPKVHPNLHQAILRARDEMNRRWDWGTRYAPLHREYLMTTDVAAFIAQGYTHVEIAQLINEFDEFYAANWSQTIPIKQDTPEDGIRRNLRELLRWVLKRDYWAKAEQESKRR